MELRKEEWAGCSGVRNHFFPVTPAWKLLTFDSTVFDICNPLVELHAHWEVVSCVFVLFLSVRKTLTLSLELSPTAINEVCILFLFQKQKWQFFFEKDRGGASDGTGDLVHSEGLWGCCLLPPTIRKRSVPKVSAWLALNLSGDTHTDTHTQTHLHTNQPAADRATGGGRMLATMSLDLQASPPKHGQG